MNFTKYQQSSDEKLKTALNKTAIPGKVLYFFICDTELFTLSISSLSSNKLVNCRWFQLEPMSTHHWHCFECMNFSPSAMMKNYWLYRTRIFSGRILLAKTMQLLFLSLWTCRRTMNWCEYCIIGLFQDPVMFSFIL